MGTTKKVLSIRIDEELKQKIHDEAILQRRNETNLVTVILEDYFENIDRTKKIAERKK